MLCNSKANRRDREKGRNAVLLAVFQKFGERKFGHPEHSSGIVEGIDEVALNSRYMSGGKMCESANVEVRLVSRSVSPAVGGRRNHRLRNNITVGKANPFETLVSLCAYS